MLATIFKSTAEAMAKLGVIMYNFLFSASFYFGLEFIFIAMSNSAYVPMWFRYPPKTWVQNKVFFGLYMALPVTLLGNGTVRRLCSNVAEINRLLRRRFWEFLFGFECCFVISHLIARGNDLGVIAISGGFAMAISAFKLVTPQASFGIPFFFLVNSAMAAAVLILAKDGLLCEASLHAMFPALLSLAAFLISVAIPPRTKIE